MAADHCDVAVAGGGLVGLSVAYELACRGAAVTVVDAGFPGRATDAGAGILSPDTMWADDAAWAHLVHAAAAHYPELLARLRDDGADTDAAAYARCGLLSLSLRPSEDEWFGPFAQRITAGPDAPVREVSADEAAELFPPLGEVHRALYCAGAARVDGRGLAAALRCACEARGVHWVHGTVCGVRGSSAGEAGGGRGVQAVRVEGADDLACGALVVAGGAWTAAMGEWLGCALPVGPTKGQIVHLGVEGDSGSWPIIQPLMTHYLVPWPDGRIACGGTFETDAGFSTTATAAGLLELLRECLSVAPGLAGAQYLQTRVGLRPTSADGQPVVGRLPDWQNAWVATGHGANGLLLGPHSGLLVADALRGAAGAELPSELHPGRFA
jgi:D-amino-acid dehydrogenase